MTEMPTRRRATRRTFLAVGGAIVLVLLIAAVAFAVGRSGRGGGPDDRSVEASFARAMSSHHAQAVEMAERIRRVTTDDNLRLMTTDIVLTQQSQIGQMRGWLQQWGLSVGAPPRSLDWMGMNHAGAMPGMASDADASSLATLPVPEAETHFLRLMIEHHRGGIVMAEAVLNRTERAEVRRFARAIVGSQQAEIDAMQDMLIARDQAPVPAPAEPQEGASEPPHGSGGH